MNLIRLFPIIAIASFAGAASAQQVTLRFKPPVGKSYTYSTTMDTSSSGAMAQKGEKGTSTSTLKVVSRAGDVTKVTLANTGVMKGGKKAPKETPMQFSVTTLGAVTTTGTGSSSQMAALGGGMMAAVGPFPPFAASPVGPGSTWKKEFDLTKMFAQQAPPGMKMTGGKLPLTMKLIKYVNQGGKKLAQISIVGKGAANISQETHATDTKAPAMNMSMAIAITINTTTLIDITTGVSAQSSATMVFGIKIGTQPAMNQTMKLTMQGK